MALKERMLDENEAKIDNILRKIIVSSQHIREIADSFENIAINEDSQNLVLERIKRIRLLSEVIENLSSLADEMDLDDEKITKEFEDRISNGLDNAIEVIKEAKKG
ncbi:MAG: hypothetical protein V1859_00440 [archaeon]